MKSKSVFVPLMILLFLSFGGCNYTFGVEDNNTASDIGNDTGNEFTQDIDISGIIHEYDLVLNSIDVSYIINETGDYVYLDNEDKCWAEINCNYSIEEIKDIISSVTTGNRRDYLYSVVESNLKSDNGKLYRFQTERDALLSDGFTLYSDKYTIKDNKENELIVLMQAWDNTYDVLRTAEITIDYEDEKWKISSISYLSGLH